MYARCPEGHCPEEVAVCPPGYEVGIMLDGHGNVTNRWEDGTVGLTKAQAMDAVDEDSAMCPEHQVEIRWIHD